MEMTVTNPDGIKVKVTYGDVEIVTDQPVSAGGGGGLPTPFELFLASVGACGGFYAFSFCKARGISTVGMRVVADIEKSGDMVQTIRLKIELPPGFPEKYRDAVVKAAQSCKVVKHLEKPPAVEVAIS